MPGIEIGAVPESVRGGGMDVDAEPLAKPEFAGGFDGRRHQPDIEKRYRDPPRVQLGVVTVGIADFGDIAVAPVAHPNTRPIAIAKVVRERDRQAAKCWTARRSKA